MLKRCFTGFSTFIQHLHTPWRQSVPDYSAAVSWRFHCFLHSWGFVSLCLMRRSLWEQVSSLCVVCQFVQFFSAPTTKDLIESVKWELIVSVCSGPSGAGSRAAGRRQRAVLRPQLGRHLRFSFQRPAGVPLQPRQGGNHRGELQS